MEAEFSYTQPVEDAQGRITIRRTHMADTGTVAAAAAAAAAGHPGPAAKKGNGGKNGGLIGRAQWNIVSLTTLLNLVEARHPMGQDGWSSVATMLNRETGAAGKAARDWLQCKTKYTDLTRAQFTGSHDVVEIKKRSREIQQRIYAGADIAQSPLPKVSAADADAELGAFVAANADILLDPSYSQEEEEEQEFSPPLVPTLNDDHAAVPAFSSAAAASLRTPPLAPRSSCRASFQGSCRATR
jgi:hypothetical protein